MGGMARLSVDISADANRLFPEFEDLCREVALGAAGLCQHIKHPRETARIRFGRGEEVTAGDLDMTRVTNRLVSFSQPRQWRKTIWQGMWIAVNVVVALGVMITLASWL